MKRFSKEECLAASKKPFLGVRFTHPGGELTYRQVGTDGEWGHFYCAELNDVRVMRRKHLTGRKATFPGPDDWIHGESYSPE